MVCTVQSNIVVVLIMTILLILITPRAQSYCSGPWFHAVSGDRQNSVSEGKIQAGSLLFWKRFYYAKVPHSRISTALRGKLSKAQEFRIEHVSFPSRAYSVCLTQSLFQSFHLPVVVYGYSMPSPSLFIMVRQGGRKRSRGRRGSGKPSMAGHSEDPEQSPINLPSSHVQAPPPSPVRGLTPNSAFQTTHFKFQSNLNRPLITAHITIILSEEENQIFPLSCMAPDLSQSSEHSMDEGSQEHQMKDKLGQDEIPRNILPLEDINPVAGEGTSGAIKHSLANSASKTDGNENLRIGSACLIVEKTPDENVEV